jgi:hypothetical protein
MLPYIPLRKGPAFRSFSFGILFLLIGLSPARSQIRVVKLNLPSAAFAATSISFEHVRDKQFAWQITATWRPDIQGPNMLFNRFDEGWELLESNSTVLGGNIAYRWYTRKGRSQPTKPYFALFTNYQQWSADASHRFNATEYSLSGEWRQWTTGLQYGVQWVIQDRWAIDLTLVGFGIAFGQLDGTGTTGAAPNVGLWEENLLSIPIVGQRILMEGQDGTYTFSDRFTTVGLHTALRIGLLF